MTKLERKFETIVKRLRKRYSFLEGVTIDVCEGYGIIGATVTRTNIDSGYDDPHCSINIDIAEIRKHYNTPRYTSRFGIKGFDHFLLQCLLHEVAHVRQAKTLDLRLVEKEALRIDSTVAHDDSWLEKEADKWANRELRKIRKGTK